MAVLDMNAYDIPKLRFSLVAAEAIQANALVSVDANGKAINANNTAIVGAALDAAAVGQAVTVADGIVKAIASAAITSGGYVSGTTGMAATSTNATNVIALTGVTVANELVTVKIN